MPQRIDTTVSLKPLRSETSGGMRIDWDVPIEMDDGIVHFDWNIPIDTHAAASFGPEWF